MAELVDAADLKFASFLEYRFNSDYEYFLIFYIFKFSFYISDILKFTIIITITITIKIYV